MTTFIAPETLHLSVMGIDVINAKKAKADKEKFVHGKQGVIAQVITRRLSHALEQVQVNTSDVDIQFIGGVTAKYAMDKPTTELNNSQEDKWNGYVNYSFHLTKLTT